MPSFVALYFKCLLIAGVSLWFGYKFFPSVPLMAATGLLALGLTAPVSTFLEENREEIWKKKTSPQAANAKLALRFTVLFIGALSCSFLYHLFFQTESIAQVRNILSDVYRNTFTEYLTHNGYVLVGGMVLSFIYRSGGLLLLLFANALKWGSIFTGYLLGLAEITGTAEILISFCAMLPHIIFEVTAYVLAGMSALFLSKAAFKYQLASTEFRQVSYASLLLFAFSVLGLVLGCLAETYLAQPFFPRA